MAAKRERDEPELDASVLALDAGEASSAQELKAAGNALFQTGDWAGALESYGAALGRGADPELTLTLHSNRAACELELAAKADDDDDAALVHFAAAASHAWQAHQLIERQIGTDKRAKVCFRLGKARLGTALCELKRTQRSVHGPMIGTGEETTAALEHQMAAEAHGVACQAIVKSLRVARVHLLEAREQQPASQDILAALTQADRALAELGGAGASGDAAEPPTAEPAVAAGSFAAGVVFARGARWIDNSVSLVVPAAGAGEGAAGEVQLPLCLRKRYAAAATAGTADGATLASATMELHVDLTYSDHHGAGALAAAATAVATAAACVAAGRGAPVAGGLFGALSAPSEGSPTLESAEEFVLDAAMQKAQPGLVLALEEAGVIERVRIGCGPTGQMRHVCRVKF